jgi:hypothetical protein
MSESAIEAWVTKRFGELWPSIVSFEVRPRAHSVRMVRKDDDDPHAAGHCSLATAPKSVLGRRHRTRRVDPSVGRLHVAEIRAV